LASLGLDEVSMAALALQLDELLGPDSSWPLGELTPDLAIRAVYLRYLTAAQFPAVPPPCSLPFASEEHA
jgi:hypothetical protein